MYVVRPPSCASAWPDTPPACEQAPSSYVSRHVRKTASDMTPGSRATTTANAQSAPAGSAARPAAKPVATSERTIAWPAEASPSRDSTIATPPTLAGRIPSSDGSTVTSEVSAVAVAAAVGVVAAVAAAVARLAVAPGVTEGDAHPATTRAATITIRGITPARAASPENARHRPRYRTLPRSRTAGERDPPHPPPPPAPRTPP